MTKTILALVSLLCLALPLRAQQEPQFSQNFSNMLIVNPAAAGAEQRTHVAAAFRNQWTDFPGAPVTATLAADHFVRKINSGFGFSTLFDTIGSMRTLNFKLAYAYRIRIRKAFLQIGADAGTKTVRLRSNFVFITPGDPSIPPPGVHTQTAPVFSLGTYFRSERFSMAFSALNLNQPEYFKNTGGIFTYSIARHYFAYFQYRQPLGTNFNLRPTLFYKTDAKSAQLDASLLTYYRDRAFLGSSYRIDDAIVLMAGIRIHKFWLQYSYDITTSALRHHSTGSHEAMLRYVIPFAGKGVVMDAQ